MGLSLIIKGCKNLFNLKASNVFSVSCKFFSKRFSLQLSVLLICFAFLSSCIKTTSVNESANNGIISDQLHFSFSTPDWNRFVPCDLLDDFVSYPLNDSTLYIHGSSASTKLIWYLSFPKDSSKMTMTSNSNRYPICDYGKNTSSFEYSQRLPITEGSSVFLGSSKGISDSSFNEVSKITYLRSDSVYAMFNIKCRYKMIMYEYGTLLNKKNVTGTFNFNVRVLRK